MLKGCRRITGGAGDPVTTGGGAGDSVTTGGAGVDSVLITGACEVWLGGGEGHLRLREQQSQHRRASQTVANTTAVSKKRANFEFICKNQ